MEVVVLLYDGVSSGEALAPWEVLRRLPGSTCRFVAERAGPRLGHAPALRLDAAETLEQVDGTDVLVIPGGFGCQELVDHERLLAWIRHVHETTQWTTAVSTGSVLLAAAGLLTGGAAATHWLATDLLVAHGARPVPDRVVRAGRLLTAVGPAAAIDMALWMAARSAGRDVAAGIQDELETGLDSSFDPATSWRAAAMVAGWHRDGGAVRGTRWPQAVWDHLGRRLPRWRPQPAAARAVRAEEGPDGDAWELRDYVSDR